MHAAEISTPTIYRNKILQNLPPEAIERLNLRRVTLEVGREMEYPGSPIDHLFFIEEGVGSMTVTLRDGSQVEVGMFGYESAVGISALMGTRRSLNRVYMQIAGRGFYCTVSSARREFRLGAEFHHVALRYVQAQLTQATQSAACNAKHDVEQRLARWLLLCADRAHSEQFGILQEFLADMLGSTRPTVTTAAGLLRERGLIEYVRGTITIVDRKGLEARACECYEVVRHHLDNYVEFDTGFVV
jgi:CRP-like cAMP-binding protein